MEAAVFGLPLAFGPHYGKFREACDLIESGGAESIADGAQLLEWFDRLYRDPAATQRAGEACRTYVESHRGATRRIVDEICR